MITITKGNEIVHSDSARGFANAIAPILTETKNKIPTLSFQIVVGNPCYDSIKHGDIITAEEDGNAIFFGMVEKITLDFQKIKKVECVGEMTFLNDTIIRPFDQFEGTVYDMISALINSHNSCADSDKQFSVGNVENVGTFTFSNDDYVSTMEFLQNDILHEIGGNIYFDSDNGNRRINYRFTIPTASQTIEFGQNMLNMTKADDYSDVFTVIVPIGKDGLTIDSVAGTDYIENQSGIALYGKRWKIAEYDADDAQTLYNMAIEDLDNGIAMIPSINLNAFDLYHMGVNFGAEKFEIGQNVIVKSDAHGINMTMEVQKITRNLLNPTSSSIIVGQIEKGMTSRVIGTEKRIEEKAEKGGGVSYPVQRVDLAADVQNSLNVFDSLGLSVINGRVYDTWEEE